MSEASPEDQIRLRAYRIWLTEGRPEGLAGEHWSIACEELTAENNLRAFVLRAPPLVRPVRRPCDPRVESCLDMVGGWEAHAAEEAA